MRILVYQGWRCHTCNPALTWLTGRCLAACILSARSSVSRDPLDTADGKGYLQIQFLLSLFISPSLVIPFRQACWGCFVVTGCVAETEGGEKISPVDLLDPLMPHLGRL